MFLLLAIGTLIAQQRHPNSGKITALKVAYITGKLNLTPDQSAKFWPIYNQYEDELRTVRRAFISKYKNMNKNTEYRTARMYIEDNLDYQEEELGLKRKYKTQMLKVISPQQLAILYQAERDFKRMLVQQLGDKSKPMPGH